VAGDHTARERAEGDDTGQRARGHAERSRLTPARFQPRDQEADGDDRDDGRGGDAAARVDPNPWAGWMMDRRDVRLLVSFTVCPLSYF